jgi:hypothetical protein
MQHGVWLDPLPLLGVLLLKTFFTARKVELHALRDHPKHDLHAAAALHWYDYAARIVDSLPRIAANQLQSLVTIVSALPPVRLHWRKIKRIWKNVLMAASILLLVWAVFILFAG